MPSRTDTSPHSQPSLNASDSQPRSAARENPFGIQQRELDSRASLITIEGELDLSTAPRLKWMLLDALQSGVSQLVVDLSAATFMDSTALGVLVGVRRRLGADERLAIVCPRGAVLRTFEFAGMDGAFMIFSELDEALAYVQRGQQGHVADSD